MALLLPVAALGSGMRHQNRSPSSNDIAPVGQSGKRILHENPTIHLECFKILDHSRRAFLAPQKAWQRHEMLSIFIGIVLDDSCPRSPYIVRCGKDIDEADMDVLETEVALISCKQLA